MCIRDSVQQLADFSLNTYSLSSEAGQTCAHRTSECISIMFKHRSTNVLSGTISGECLRTQGEHGCKVDKTHQILYLHNRLKQNQWAGLSRCSLGNTYFKSNFNGIPPELIDLWSQINSNSPMTMDWLTNYWTDCYEWHHFLYVCLYYVVPLCCICKSALSL